jgi:hypothetical protein
VGPAFSPLDEELQLLPGNLSPNLAEGLTRLGLWLPFWRAREALNVLTGARVSEATARRETLAAGAALEALEAKAVDLLEAEAPAASATAARWLQVSVDGAMVPLVGGDWAEARTLVVAQLRCGDGNALEARDLSYFSRMTDHASFSRLATMETHRRGVELAETVVAVNDGAEWIQEFLDIHCPDAVRILDWAHASGYVHAAGHAVFGETCGEWCGTQLRVLRHGEPVSLLLELIRLEDTLDENDPVRATVAQSLTYLAKRLDQIQYATFARLGYPIGSGIVESANRTVVQSRLKGAGMHWAATSVNPLLALRSVACSDRWDEFWRAIAGQLRYADRHRRRCRQQERAARSCPQQAQEPPPARPPMFVDGHPTKDHPWNRRPAVRPRRRAKL